MTAQMFKCRQIRNALVNKLHCSYNDWANRGFAPQYVKSARMFMLSKTSSAKPPLGEVRSIAIMTQVGKVYQKLLLSHLTKTIQDQHTLHPSQAGFMQQKSTLTNVYKLAQFM